MSQDFFLKYILVGNPTVGKSALLHRFIKHKFKSDTVATVGVDCRERDILVKDKTFGLMVWDTAGMEIYRTFTANFFRSSAVAIFVYDISIKDTFLALPEWMDIVHQNCSSNQELIKVVVGNKCDLPDEKRTVGTTEGEEWAQANGCDLFLEVSALSGKNVDEIFEKSAGLFYDKYKQGLIDITNESIGFLLGPKQLDLASGGEGGYCFC